MSTPFSALTPPKRFDTPVIARITSSLTAFPGPAGRLADAPELEVAVLRAAEAGPVGDVAAELADVRAVEHAERDVLVDRAAARRDLAEHAEDRVDGGGPRPGDVLVDVHRHLALAD